MPPRRAALRLEPLEARLAPVVGAFAEAPAVPPGTGYDGVVLLESLSPFGGSTGSGSLLETGSHILTAAHCLVDEFGEIDSTTTNVTFHLLDGTTPHTITLTVPRSNYRIHPNYNGNVLAGSDVALLVLPDPIDPAPTRQMIAPFGAQRYGLYEGGDELG
ncbi:MAG: trypsin-like serine protease [Gemmataceae bacterium]